MHIVEIALQNSCVVPLFEPSVLESPKEDLRCARRMVIKNSITCEYHFVVNCKHMNCTMKRGEREKEHSYTLVYIWTLRSFTRDEENKVRSGIARGTTRGSQQFLNDQHIRIYARTRSGGDEKLRKTISPLTLSDRKLPSLISRFSISSGKDIASGLEGFAARINREMRMRVWHLASDDSS